MSLNLSKLRTDPKTVCDKYGFIVKNTLFKEDSGGACKLKLRKLHGNVYELEPLEGNGDWFFPYRPEVGYCSVPVGQPEGTIGLTGGMNGCALEVYKNNGNFDFYHDTNGCHLHKNNDPPGERVCHVPYRTYAGALSIGQNQAADLSQKHKTSVYFQHTLICVRNGGRWKVYVTGVHSYGVSGKHSTFRPTISCLLTSFADA